MSVSPLRDFASTSGHRSGESRSGGDSPVALSAIVPTSRTGNLKLQIGKATGAGEGKGKRDRRVYSFMLNISRLVSFLVIIIWYLYSF